MREETERNEEIAAKVLKGDRLLREIGEEYNLSAVRIEEISKAVFRKKIKEERMKCFAAVSAAKEYHDRLEQLLLRPGIPEEETNKRSEAKGSEQINNTN